MSSQIRITRTAFGHASVGCARGLGHRGPITSIALTGRWIATGGYDNDVILHNAAAGTAVDRVSCDHLVNRVTFDRTGRVLAVASSDCSGRLYAIEGGRLRLRSILGGHEDDVEDIAVSRDGRRVATASRDHTVGIHGLDGTRLLTLRGHAQDVLSVAWGGDGRTLYTSGDDGTVRRWDAAQGTERGRLIDGDVETDALAVTERGLCLCGDDAGHLVVITDGRRRSRVAHEAGIKRLVLDEAGRRLLSLSYDRTAAVWQIDGDELTLQHRLTIPPEVWSRSAVFQGEDRILFGSFGTGWAAYDLRHARWDLSQVGAYASLNAVAVFHGSVWTIGDSGLLHRNGVVQRRLGSSCNFLQPFGGVLLAGGQTGELFDGITGAVLVRHRSPLNCAAIFRLDGRDCAAVGTYTGEAILLRAGPTGVEVMEIRPLHGNAIKGLAVGGATLFSVDATGAAGWLALDDRQSGGKVLAGAHRRIANGCVALPQGRFASISRDRRLRLWLGGDGEEFSTPHRNSIKCVAASADGAWLATGDYRGGVGLFEVAARRWRGIARPTTAGIASLTPDGAGSFLAASYDGVVYRIGQVSHA